MKQLRTLLPGLAVLLVAAAPSAPAQVFVTDFKTMGTFTTPALDDGGLLTLTADDGSAPADVNVLNLNGLGVVGGIWDNMCDSDEALLFDFDGPVVGVRYTVFVANNLDGDGLVGESFLEAFDGTTSLGVLPVNDTGWHDVSTLFGDVPITGFSVRADGEGNRINSLTYQASPWEVSGAALAGTHGAPELSGIGSMQPSTTVGVSASDLLENQFATLVMGFSTLNAPLKGGVLVPATDVLVFGIPTGPLGAFTLTSAMPASMPSGLSLHMQAWLPDPAGVQGWAATNRLSGTTP